MKFVFHRMGLSVGFDLLMMAVYYCSGRLLFAVLGEMVTEGVSRDGSSFTFGLCFARIFLLWSIQYNS